MSTDTMISMLGSFMSCSMSQGSDQELQSWKRGYKPDVIQHHGDRKPVTSCKVCGKSKNRFSCKGSSVFRLPLGDLSFWVMRWWIK